jgi:hypothetical protein
MIRVELAQSACDRSEGWGQRGGVFRGPQYGKGFDAGPLQVGTGLSEILWLLVFLVVFVGLPCGRPGFLS